MEFHYVEKISIKFSFWNEAGTKGLISIVNKPLATWLLFIKFLVNKSNISDLIIIIIINNNNNNQLSHPCDVCMLISFSH